ncbi:GntR family transcriptional regulator [Rhizomonospora bruguierae]|uniref:GntR family transcriptional regulator n=1 Tax=Rhizomonospora bruguierae TaxID=1581705 RepID=UPI001BCB23E8|nr:GntR family transcriptional regulator [Micromonospora sp. NBRC 107566]
MPIETAPPKYALIVNTIQRRIEDGTYPTDSTLPSETALIAEFGVSRPTVVRALEILREQGWIEAHHGKGRTVRPRSAVTARRSFERGYGLMNEAESAAVQVLSAGPVPAPARVASALAVPEGTAVIARRRLVVAEGIGPVELGTAYLLEDLAAGTDVGEPAPLAESLLAHVAKRKGVVFDHVVERVSARQATADEARLLEIGRRDPLLTAMLAVCDRAGRCLVAIDVQLPPSRHEIEDVFAL